MSEELDVGQEAPATEGIESQEGENQNPDSRYVELEQNVTSLNDKFDQLIGVLGKQQSQAAAPKPQAEMPKLSETELKAMQANPALIAQYIENQTKQSLSTVDREIKKNRYDLQAEKEFPMLKSDKKFNDAVLKQMEELIATGEMKPDSPTLTLRACQLAAFKMKPDGKSDSKPSAPTSVQPNSSPSRSMNGASSNVKVDNSDPRMVFAIKSGWFKGKEKKLEEFRKSLAPYEAPQRRRGRTLTRG